MKSALRRVARKFEARLRRARRVDAARETAPSACSQEVRHAEAAELAKLIESMRRAQPVAPASCFYFSLCRNVAEIDKCGRSVCRACAAARMRGREYPLRAPTRKPLYSSDRAASDACDMESASPPARRRSGYLHIEARLPPDASRD